MEGSIETAEELKEAIENGELEVAELNSDGGVLESLPITGTLTVTVYDEDDEKKEEEVVEF